MKKTVCIVLLSLCTLLKSDTSDLKLGITANNATLVNILLQNTVLTPNEKQLLLELATKKSSKAKYKRNIFHTSQD